MEVLSVRDYRNNLANSFTRAENGENVLIRRRNKLYALVSIGSEDMIVTPDLQRRINEARNEMAQGKTLHFKNAADVQNWMDEL